MATWYVNSHATGANNGTSWTDAWTSLGSATTGAAAGDTVLVDKTHSESIGAITTWTFAGTVTSRVIILCVDSTASNALATGATVAVSGNFNTFIAGSIWCYGLTLQCWNTTAVNSGSNSTQNWDNCTFQVNPGASSGVRSFTFGGTSGTETRLRNCTVDIDTNGNVNSKIGLKNLVWFVNSTVRCNSAAAAILTPLSAGLVYLDGCDLSASTCTTLWNWNSQGGYANIARCNLPVGYTATTGAAGSASNLTIEGSVAGSITVPPLGLTYYQDVGGSIQSVLTRYRTGGASDGDQVNPISWEMDASAQAIPYFVPLRSPPLYSAWVTAGGAKTFTVYVAGSAQLDASQLWIELSGPTDTTPRYTNGKNATTRANPQSTPGLVPLDSGSTWNGTGVGVPMKLTITYTPTIDGPATVRVCLAQTSGTLYVDPEVYVS